MPMLALDDESMDILLAAARPVDRRHRDAFLREVATALAPYPVIGPGLVARTAHQLQHKYAVAPQTSQAHYVNKIAKAKRRT